MRAFLVVLGVVLAVVAAMFLFVPDGEIPLGPSAPDEPRPAGETMSVRGDADAVEPPVRADAAGIEGSVRDAEGLPVAGARVVAFRREEPGVSAISDEEGRFRCAGLPAGTIRGIVLDRKGRPFGRGQVAARVTARPEGWDPERHGRFLMNSCAFLTESGRFRLDPGPITAATLFVALGEERIGQLDVGPGQDEVVIRLEHSLAPPKPPAVLTGRVIDGAGRPVAGARVAFGDRQTPTDEDGRFRLEGAHGLFGAPAVTAPGFVPHLLARVAIGAGEETLVPDVVLRHVGTVIRGRVTGREGRPLTGARIAAVHAELPATTAYTGADGRFRIARVPPGRNSFSVEAGGKTKGFRVEVEDGRVQTVEWRLED